MTRRAAAGLCLAAAVALWSCADPAAERFGRAEKALLSHRFEEALQGYRSIPREFPQSRYAPTALLREAEIFGGYYRNSAAALEAYESLVFTYPRAAEVPKALLRQGEIRLLQLSDPAEAAIPLERIRQAHAGFEAMDETLFLLARTYAVLPDPARQVARLTELIESFPGSSRAMEARWALADALLAYGNPGEAYREFRKILLLSPDGAPAARARWGLSRALEETGDLPGAVAECEAMAAGAEDRAAVEERIRGLKARLGSGTDPRRGK